MIEVMILAGGKGTRLASVVSGVPKPLANINGVPFLERLILSLKGQGFIQFRLLVGHLGAMIIEHFGHGERLGVAIEYSFEDTPLGTGGAIKNGLMDSRFDQHLVLNGDTYLQTSLRNFSSSIINDEIQMGVVAHPSPTRFGKVLFSNGYVTSMQRCTTGEPGYINAGIYRLSKKHLPYMPPEKSFSFEEHHLPRMIELQKVRAFSLEGTFIDIGVPDDYQLAQTMKLF